MEGASLNDGEWSLCENHQQSPPEAELSRLQEVAKSFHEAVEEFSSTEGAKEESSGSLTMPSFGANSLPTKDSLESYLPTIAPTLSSRSEFPEIIDDTIKTESTNQELVMAQTNTRKALEICHQTIDSVQKQMETLKQENAQLIEKITTQEEKLAAELSQKKDLELENQELRKSVYMLRSRCDQITSQHDEDDDELIQKLDKAIEEVNQFGEEKQKLKREALELKRANDELMARIDDLQHVVEEKQEEIHKLRRSTQEADNQIEHLRKAVEENQQSGDDDLRQLVEKYSKENALLKDAVRSYREDIKKLERSASQISEEKMKDIRSLQSILEDLSNENEMLRSDLEREKNANSKQLNVISLLRNQLMEKENDAPTRNEDYLKTQKLMTAYKVRAEDLEKANRFLHEDKQELQKTIDELSNEIEELQKNERSVADQSYSNTDSDILERVLIENGNLQEQIRLLQENELFANRTIADLRRRINGH